MLEAILLGLIQGITEWLPISSSGHLVLAESLLGLQQPLSFAVALHGASLVVILIVFRKKILQLFSRDSIPYVLKIGLATIPIAITGLLLRDLIESLFVPSTVSIGLFITAFFLWLSRYPSPKATLSYTHALAIGGMQAFALLPGISRSGITIATAMLLGIQKEEAAEFSFMLAIPAILGAVVLEAPGVNKMSVALAVSVLVTIIAGLFSLHLLLRLVRTDKFSWFAYYCAALALVTLII